MNGASAELSAKTINVDINIKSIMMGNNQYFLRFFINPQNSFIVSVLLIFGIYIFI